MHFNLYPWTVYCLLPQEPYSKGFEMKPALFALSLVIVMLVGCSTTADSSGEAQRTELRPGYFDPE
jgi:hypothetical protein